MKKNIFLSIILLLLIIAGNCYVFYKIRDDYRVNTLISLDSDLIMKDDVKWINDNHEFYQLKLENGRLKYDVMIKMLWTIDIILLIAFLSTLRISKKI